jgi:SAM-dependent methyltransferase
MDLRPHQYKITDFNTPENWEKALLALREKKCLHDIYVEIYNKIMKLRDTYLITGGDVLEIGSGGSFMRELFPEVIASDIVKIDHLNLVLNAEHLPFGNQTLDAIVAVHVIHHIPDITKFLSEATRCLKRGGGVICVEPFWSPVAKILYKKIHPEPFDETTKSWQLPESNKNWTNSNQALSFILLKRDRDKFAECFPEYEVVGQEPFGFLRYLMTGGLWLEPKLPPLAFPLLKALEWLLKPLMPLLAIHHVFVLKKIDDLASRY